MSTSAQAARDIDFPPGFQYLFEPHRYKVAHGGRGSAKSWSIARALLIQSCSRPHRILCARELQNSIAESVHRVLCDQIEIMGLGDYFEIQQQGIYRRPYPTETSGLRGSEFFFYGIRSNPTKVKSAEGITICWVEEAEKVSENSWEILIPTIRAPGSEIWISFNPDEENDPTYQRFVLNPPPDCVAREFNWQHNPWFPDTLRAEKDYLYRVDPEAAAHVWGGECRRNASSQIFRGKYVVDSFEVPIEPAQQRLHGWDGPYFGADWGFARDPTVLTKLWIKDKNNKCNGKLFVEKESWGIGVELDDIGPKWRREIPECVKFAIRADCSRPETISHVKSHSGLRVEAAEKWSGSVEDGIAWLKSFEQIVIHPRCEHQQEEARLYSYKVDRLTGDVLAEVVDKHNHCWDAARYACQPLITAGSALSVWARLGG